MGTSKENNNQSADRAYPQLIGIDTIVTGRTVFYASETEFPETQAPAQAKVVNSTNGDMWLFVRSGEGTVGISLTASHARMLADALRGN